MKITRWMQHALIYILSGYVLATLFQNYYSVYVHLILFFLCLILNSRFNYKAVCALGIGAAACILFVLFAIYKETFDPITQVGVFLHYTTWPVLYLSYKDKFNSSEKTRFLCYILIICILNNVLSLIALFDNREISRLLAGAASPEQRQEYFGKGVGGYGHVYAMVFLTLAALYWCIKTKSIPARVILIVFLVSNYMFILYSSYTTAIFLTLILTFFAITMRTKSAKTTVIVAAVILMLLVFGNELLKAGISIADRLKLDFVAKHLSQLQALQSDSEEFTLRRLYYYSVSWDSFVSNPFIGGSAIGGHSQLLDCLAKMGIFGLSFFGCTFYFGKACTEPSCKKPFVELYLLFFVFMCIDTCEVAQLPLILYYICPMMFTLCIQKEEQIHA